MKKHIICTLHFALCALVAGTAAHATNFPTSGGQRAFSQYGQIQNVQNYSSNPFWNQNSPYNQKMPSPIYAQGTDLNAAECMSTVSAIIAQQCGMRDNCRNMRLSDIKPVITIQLSNMTGANYVSSCGGYIDTAFSDYQKTYQVTTTGHANFPRANVPGSGTSGENTFEIENPYKKKKMTWSGEQWHQEMADRMDELDAFHEQSGGTTHNLTKSAFPTTMADLTFEQRLANTQAGYDDAASRGLVGSSYVVPKWETTKERYAREAEEATERKAALDAQRELDKFSMSKLDYCNKHPGDTAYCNGNGSSSDRIKVILKSLIKK